MRYLNLDVMLTEGVRGRGQNGNALRAKKQKREARSYSGGWPASERSERWVACDKKLSDGITHL